MKFINSFLLINNVKLSVNASEKEAFSVARGILRRAGLESFVHEYAVYRRSIDARKKPDIYYVYSIAASGDFPEIPIEKQKKFGISVEESQVLKIPTHGDKQLSAPPVIVGSGPCGLFAALILAEAGYKPIILERGGCISARTSAVKRFNEEQILNTETNIQFGAGGAGTFSDGKLVTRVNDPLTSYILDRFVDFGAPGEIRFIAKPHVGTDVLSKVIDNMIARICDLGGKIYYNTTFISEVSEFGVVTAVRTNKGEFPCGALILAIGHSARDTYEYLIRHNLNIEAKPISVGMRIEHLADDIDRAMYGTAAGTPGLGHAEYNLSCNTKARGTYTFCMCPGGIVVAAASESDSVVVNGMSYHARAGKNSNSAVVTSVFKDDYGSTPMAAIDFQRRIERAAFIAGGANYYAPIITVGDFLSGELKTEPKRILPEYMCQNEVKLARPEDYLPKFVTDGISSALLDFDKKIRGFAVYDAVLTGAETRTSAPLRILRDQDTRLASGYLNLFPAGEGAGYAGGITSAAIDGVKSALALIKKYKSC